MDPSDTVPTLDAEQAVRDRYTRAARAREPLLCCAVDYDARYLEAIPREILERDYGCGDPSRHAREGDILLDLGSGAGKICFIAAQVVGPEGFVIGVDMNDEMLSLARRAAPEVARRIGYSGAFCETEVLQRLEDAGFHGIAIETWTDEPFRVVEGIEFRSVTVTAHKGKAGPCREGGHAVIYRGPWKQVEDDDHHVLRRGERAAVCDKTFRLLTSAPYAEHLIPIPRRVPIPEAERAPFDCSRTASRHPRETKGEAYRVTTGGDASCCGPDGCG